MVLTLYTGRKSGKFLSENNDSWTVTNIFFRWSFVQFLFAAGFWKYHFFYVFLIYVKFFRRLTTIQDFIISHESFIDLA